NRKPKNRKPKSRNRRRCRQLRSKTRRRQVQSRRKATRCQLQRLTQPNLPKNRPSQKKNSQPQPQQLRKAFHFRLTLRKRRSSKPKAAKTFTQALRTCWRPSITLS